MSLTECCVALTILSILLVMTVWGNGGLLQQQLDKRMTALGASQLQAALNLARSEALKSAGRAVVCKSRDGMQCISTGTWTQGWIVFRDDNNNGLRELEESVVMVTQTPSTQIRIAGNVSLASYVSFQPDGSAATAAGAFQAGTFTICGQPGSSSSGQLIVLSATGRTRQQQAGPSHCA